MYRFLIITTFVLSLCFQLVNSEFTEACDQAILDTDLGAFSAYGCDENSTSAFTIICTGVCRTFYDNIIIPCTSSTSNADDRLYASIFQRELAFRCGGGEATNPTIATVDPVACSNANIAYSSNIMCQQVAQGNDASSACTGTCRSLANAIIDACGNLGLVTQDDINQVCGGADILKKFGVYSLLLIALITMIANVY